MGDNERQIWVGNIPNNHSYAQLLEDLAYSGVIPETTRYEPRQGKNGWAILTFKDTAAADHAIIRKVTWCVGGQIAILRRVHPPRRPLMPKATPSCIPPPPAGTGPLPGTRPLPSRAPGLSSLDTPFKAPPPPSEAKAPGLRSLDPTPFKFKQPPPPSAATLPRWLEGARPVYIDGISRLQPKWSPPIHQPRVVYPPNYDNALENGSRVQSDDVENVETDGTNDEEDIVLHSFLLNTNNQKCQKSNGTIYRNHILETRVPGHIVPMCFVQTEKCHHGRSNKKRKYFFTCWFTDIKQNSQLQTIAVAHARTLLTNTIRSWNSRELL